MPYRVKPEVPLVCVKNRAGRVIYHYAKPPHGMTGPIIPWLSDDQAAHLTRIGYVERLDDDELPDTPAVDDESSITTAPTPKTPAAEPQQPTTQPAELDQLLLSESTRNGIDLDRLHACIEAINALRVPAGTGAPKIRAMLREAGQRWTNDVICAAVRARKAFAEAAV